MKQPEALTQRRLAVGWLRCKDVFANTVGWCFEKLKAPAMLKAFEFVDPETDQTVYLSTSKRFAVLCVGPRRFYFDRLTGKFDGMSAAACSVAGRVEFRD